MGGRILNRLRVVRTARELTQNELAELAGISRPTLSRIERDKSEPSLSIALRLAEVLGVEVSELFQLSETEKERLRAGIVDD